MEVIALYTYPVKSLGHIALSAVAVESRGLKYDRRWMIVDEAGRFLTQREHPVMATIDIEMTCGELQLSCRRGAFGTTSLPAVGIQEGEDIMVKVWSDQVKAKAVGMEADQWLQDVLKQKCRLVFMPGDASRPADSHYTSGHVDVSFADAFPFLLANTASLEDLNMRIGSEMSMLRFRPNIVVNGETPFAEDLWKKIRIGSLVFHLVKPCARCVVTTIEPGTDRKGPEPLRTLAEYRKKDNKIIFGQNMVVEQEGIISVGDPVEVMD